MQPVRDSFKWKMETEIAADGIFYTSHELSQGYHVFKEYSKNTCRTMEHSSNVAMQDLCTSLPPTSASFLSIS